jgi:hypothetical protein
MSGERRQTLMLAHHKTPILHMKRKSALWVCCRSVYALLQASPRTRNGPEVGSEKTKASNTIAMTGQKKAYIQATYIQATPIIIRRAPRREGALGSLWRHDNGDSSRSPSAQPRLTRGRSASVGLGLFSYGTGYGLTSSTR